VKSVIESRRCGFVFVPLNPHSNVTTTASVSSRRLADSASVIRHSLVDFVNTLRHHRHHRRRHRRSQQQQQRNLDMVRVIALVVNHRVFQTRVATVEFASDKH